MRLLIALLVCLPLVAQSRYLVAVWDNECKDVPRSNCWGYAYLPDGWKVEKATLPEAPSWALQIVLPAGTANPNVVVRFNVEDFAVVHADSEDTVSVRWPIPIEGGLAAGQPDFTLIGFTVKPLACAVYRNGLRLSWAFHDFEIVSPVVDGGEWMLRFPAYETASFVQAFCIRSQEVSP